MLKQPTIWSRYSTPNVLAIIAAVMILCSNIVGLAQHESSFDDNDADPTRLFERGQGAHARGDLERAVGFYEEAIKLKPEFPEAEFQRGTALVALKRFAEAETAFRRATALKSNWAMPHASLGLLLVRLNRDRDAEIALRQAHKLDPQNELVLRLLADIRLRSGDAREALDLARRATALKDAPPAAWIVKAMAEKATGARIEAAATLDHVLQLEPDNVPALIERADLFVEENKHAEAIKLLITADRIQPKHKAIASRLAIAYERNGQPDDARRVAQGAGLISQAELSADGTKVLGSPEEIEAANSDDPTKARAALRQLLEKNPGSAMLLARLGASYRTDDPVQSLELYRRASELQPKNPDYATGYASALVQARRFVDATTILRRVLAFAPDSYAAHANLATALYAQKSYAEALVEYSWIVRQKPDLAIAYYFIATAHDNLGQYTEALAAYESFVARADAQTNQLEIDKVKLRLPLLRRQVQLGEGVKPKTSKKN